MVRRPGEPRLGVGGDTHIWSGRRDWEEENERAPRAGGMRWGAVAGGGERKSAAGEKRRDGGEETRRGRKRGVGSELEEGGGAGGRSSGRSQRRMARIRWERADLVGGGVAERLGVGGDTQIRSGRRGWEEEEKGRAPRAGRRRSGARGGRRWGAGAGGGERKRAAGEKRRGAGRGRGSSAGGAAGFGPEGTAERMGAEPRYASGFASPRRKRRCAGAAP